jgi:hypothetical protein
MQESFRVLAAKLEQKHRIELVYLNAPLISPVASRTEPCGSRCLCSGTCGRNQHSECAQVSDTDNEQRRTWFIKDQTVATTCEKRSQGPSLSAIEDLNCHYHGLDASLLLLQQVWFSRPFWGIIAVGQAAPVAALLALQPEIANTDLRLSTFITIDPEPSLLPHTERLTEGLPCLHIADDIGYNSNDEELAREPLIDSSHSTKNDKDFHPTGCYTIVQQFGGQLHLRSKLKSKTTTKNYDLNVTAAEMNVIGRFLIRNRNELVASATRSTSRMKQEIIYKDRSTDLTALIMNLKNEINKLPQDSWTLRKQLHDIEEIAAEVLASHVSNNPPAALMAFIRPNFISGWGGNTRLRPGEQGGGAPCPADFLLPQEERLQLAETPITPIREKNDDKFND